MNNELKATGKENILVQDVNNSAVTITVSPTKREKASNEHIWFISLISIIFIPFCIGAFQGYLTKEKYSNDYFFKVLLTSQLTLCYDDSLYYLAYNAKSTNYRLNVQNDHLDKYTHYIERSEIKTLKERIPYKSLAVLGVSEGLIHYYKLTFNKYKNGKQYILAVLCAVSTYSMGYWALSRTIPENDDPRIIKLLENPDERREIKRMAVDRFLNSIQIDVSGSNKYVLKHSFFYYADSSLIQDSVIKFRLKENERKTTLLKKKLIDPDKQIFSDDFDVILEREKLFRYVWTGLYLKDEFIINDEPYVLRNVDSFDWAIGSIDLY